jgi:hypothetical protein
VARSAADVSRSLLFQQLEAAAAAASVSAQSLGGSLPGHGSGGATLMAALLSGRQPAAPSGPLPFAAGGADGTKSGGAVVAAGGPSGGAGRPGFGAGMWDPAACLATPKVQVGSGWNGLEGGLRVWEASSQVSISEARAPHLYWA